MIESAALFYGLIASFILSSTQRNTSENRPHPRTVLYLGWMMMGGSFAASAALLFVAARQWLIA